jgi:Tfp pilus assembly protein PilO
MSRKIYNFKQQLYELKDRQKQLTLQKPKQYELDNQRKG